MKKQRILFAILLLACCSGPAWMTPPGKTPLESTQPLYLDAGQFETLPFAAPPAPDSDDQKADIAAMVYWKGKRTGADCARAEETFYVKFDSLWGGKNPFPQPLPIEVTGFFNRLDSEIGTVARIMKNRFQRSRPDFIPPCPGSSSGGYSYPSTHAAISRVFAYVLADLVPERKAEFIAKADAIAQDRLIIGVHYPTDIAAGKELGELLHARLLQSEAYREDLVRIRALRIK